MQVFFAYLAFTTKFSYLNIISYKYKNINLNGTNFHPLREKLGQKCYSIFSKSSVFWASIYGKVTIVCSRRESSKICGMFLVTEKSENLS